VGATDEATTPTREAVRAGLVGVLLAVGLLGMVFGVARVRSVAHGRVLQTNTRAAEVAARALVGGESPDQLAAAWARTGAAEELLFVDGEGVVTRWESDSGTVGAPIEGELRPVGEGEPAAFGDALRQGHGVVGYWSRSTGSALVSAAPLPDSGGWVVVATPVSRVRALFLPIVPPALLLLLGLVGAVVTLSASLRSARSARDLAGAFRSARAAERHRLRRVTRDLPALLFERITFPEGGGAFTWVSPNSTDILETDATDLVVHPELLFGLVLPADLAGLHAAIRASGAAPHVLRWEGRLALPSGRLRWFRAQARRVEIVERGGRWCGFLVDITDERALEARLKQRGRLATVGQLAAGVAHEINNPLSYVIGNTRFVLEAAADGEITLPEELRQALEDAADGGERVARIVQDLRTLARGGELGEEPGPIDLEGVLRTAARQVEMDLRFRARLSWEVPPDLPLVHGHDDRLVQVFHNLLKNATLAIPPGDPGSHEVRIFAERTDGGVCVRITDTGHGVPERIRDRIFDPFFTTRDGTAGGVQGQGLGLSVCLSIVNRLGGTLSLRPSDAHGACFEVVLERARGSAGVVRDAVPTLTPGEPLRLLVVDDEDGLLRVASRQLRPHAVVGVSSGAGALSLLAHDAAFDAVVCDVMMPGMSGVELYEALIAGHPRLARRFVFLTGGSVSAEIEAWLERARVPLLEKPVARDALIDAVAKVRRRASRAERDIELRRPVRVPPPASPDISVPPM
jgi:signal transduction histidine kinase